MKKIVKLSCLIVTVIIVIMIASYFTKPLHGDDKIAYDLIVENCGRHGYFRGATNLTIISGSARENPFKCASILISYTNENGQHIRERLYIDGNYVTDIEEAERVAKDETQMIKWDINRKLSESKSALNLDAINEELKKVN